MNQVARQVKGGEVTLINVLLIASSTGGPIPGRNCFEIFKGDSARLNQFLNQLHNETAEHAKSIKAALDRVYKQANLL